MERFVTLVNGFQSLTIITKCSILDVAAVLDPPLSKCSEASSYVSYVWKFPESSKNVVYNTKLHHAKKYDESRH